MPFREEGAEEILHRVIGKTLTTTVDPAGIGNSRFLVVIVGTPVDEHLNPEFAGLKNLFRDLLPYLRKEHIIVLRSTVYPGISEKIQTYLNEQVPGIQVCFCPERIAEGKAIEELHSLPQIVSGFDAAAVSEVGVLFRRLTEHVIVMTPMEAELTKLFTNSWRYIQFAIANQFYMIAEEYGVDFRRIHAAMTYEYPRTRGFPKPGFTAGPCLFKDTMQISAFTNNKFFLGHSAMLVNEGLPNFIVGQIKKKHPLHTLRVGILGMAFKGESDDKRESLSYKLKKILEVEAREVMTSDKNIASESHVSETELIERCDLIIIGAPHQRYRTLDLKGKVLVDIWNVHESGPSGENLLEFVP
jgi:UDP-N-acetyl-D-mannosaminuronic acid dehydrogenase